MIAADVLTEAGRRLVLVTADGGRLRLRGPAEGVDAVRPLVAAHKAELLATVALVCSGCSQGMVPTPPIADGCGWAGCRNRESRS